MNPQKRSSDGYVAIPSSVAGVPMFCTNEVHSHVLDHGSDDGLQALQQGLAEAIDKALATERADFASLDLTVWRLPSPKARKKKPVALKATIYEHPQYGKQWILISDR